MVLSNRQLSAFISSPQEEESLPQRHSAPIVPTGQIKCLAPEGELASDCSLDMELRIVPLRGTYIVLAGLRQNIWSLFSIFQIDGRLRLTDRARFASSQDLFLLCPSYMLKES